MFDSAFIESLPIYAERSSSELPLAGVRVVDFTHYVAGPLATMILSDFGADVIKIEGPGGDRFRFYPPHESGHPEEGGAFLWANRGKRSIEIDLKSESGRSIVHDLLARADVLVENFASGVMERLGFGWESIKERYPSLIYCSVSAYGRSGRFSKRPGFDTVVQAESGFVSMNGYPDRPGVRTSSAVMDIGTALFSAIGILNALYRREKKGVGGFVEIPLFAASLMMDGYASIQSLCTGVATQRRGNTSADSCPTGVFSCKDAEFFLHCGNSGIFIRLMRDVLERVDIANDERYQLASDRLAHQSELFQLLNKEFDQYDWATLSGRFTQFKVPAGKVRDILEALRSEEADELGLVERIPHSSLGWIPNLKLPVFLDGCGVGGASAAPRRGEDSCLVLGDVLGYSEERVRKLIEEGAVFSLSDN